MKSWQKISILRVLQVMCAALVLLIQSALAQTATHTDPSDPAVVPVQQGYVVDTTGRLSAAERDSLISELKQLNASSGVQVFVLIVDHTDPEPIESYAPVSYTHLDVYKRQHSHSPGTSCSTKPHRPNCP